MYLADCIISFFYYLKTLKTLLAETWYLSELLISGDNHCDSPSHVTLFETFDFTFAAQSLISKLKREFDFLQYLPPVCLSLLSEAGPHLVFLRNTTWLHGLRVN